MTRITQLPISSYSRSFLSVHPPCSFIVTNTHQRARTPLNPNTKSQSRTYTSWMYMSFTEKLIHTIKQASYAGIIIGGIGGLGFISYTLYKELVSPESSNAVFAETLDWVKANKDVQEFFKDPKTGNSIIRGVPHLGGSRRQLRSVQSVQQQLPDGRIKTHVIYYLEGADAGESKYGMVQAETIHAPNHVVGKREYVYVIAELVKNKGEGQGKDKKRVVILDNRPKPALKEKNKSKSWFYGLWGKSVY